MLVGEHTKYRKIKASKLKLGKCLLIIIIKKLNIRNFTSGLKSLDSTYYREITRPHIHETNEIQCESWYAIHTHTHIYIGYI